MGAIFLAGGAFLLALLVLFVALYPMSKLEWHEDDEQTDADDFFRYWEHGTDTERRDGSGAP
jgi:hypothetical protein